MKQLFQTAQGTHIIEATSSELANLLMARKAIDAVCDEFTFVIRPTEPVQPAALHNQAIRFPAPPPAVKASSKASVRIPAKKTPAKESGSLEPRVCRGCGKTFNPKRKDQNCCKVACRRKLPRTSKAAKPVATPPAPKSAAPATSYHQGPPVVPATAKVDRLAAIRAADRRLREKGIQAPSVWSGSDSGIGAPTADDIAEVTRGKQY